MEIISATFAIKQNYNELSIKEKKIADFVLAHPEDSVNPSIEELGPPASASVKPRLSDSSESWGFRIPTIQDRIGEGINQRIQTDL
jgi:hypothetical protein